MTSDEQTNAVYISDLLEQKHPDTAKSFLEILGDRLKTIPNTKDIWCRDFMPIQLAQNRFIQFKYRPDYLKGYPHLRTENGCDLLGLEDCPRSNLVIDGGNIVRWNDLAILTEKVFSENPNYEPDRFVWQLKKELEARRLIFVPQELGRRAHEANGP